MHLQIYIYIISDGILYLYIYISKFCPLCSWLLAFPNNSDFWLLQKRTQDVQGTQFEFASRPALPSTSLKPDRQMEIDHKVGPLDTSYN